MAKCHLICDAGVEKSHVETIAAWFSEKGHELVRSEIMDAEDGNYIQIGCGFVKVRVNGITTAFWDTPETEIGEGVSVRLSFGKETHFIEQCLNFLDEHL